MARSNKHCIDAILLRREMFFYIRPSHLIARFIY